MNNAIAQLTHICQRQFGLKKLLFVLSTLVFLWVTTTTDVSRASDTVKLLSTVIVLSSALVTVVAALLWTNHRTYRELLIELDISQLRSKFDVRASRTLSTSFLLLGMVVMSTLFLQYVIL